MAEIRIPFLPEFTERLLDGRKTMTSRFRRYGDVGDEFPHTGGRFELVNVSRIHLVHVGRSFYHAEGFETEEQFWDCWKRIHPKRTDTNLKVWVHEFRRIA